MSGDDLLVFQTPAEAVAKNMRSYQTPQSTGGSANTSLEFSQPRHTSSYLSTSSSPASSSSSIEESSNVKTQNRKSGINRLKEFFDCCDFNLDGRLTEDELCYALRNYDQSEFSNSCSRTMIKLFNKSKVQEKSVNFDEFCEIWSYLGRWRNVFEKHDVDNDLAISKAEFVTTLQSFGYKLADVSIDNIFRLFANYNGKMKYDAFIESMIWVMKVNDFYTKYENPEKQKESVNISYADFVDVLLTFKE